MIWYVPAWQALRYRRARRRAVAEVPWYREEWLAAPPGPEPPVATVDQLERQAFRFFPISSPMRPHEDVAASFDPAVLLDALGWAIGPIRCCLVVECRPAVLDVRWLSRRRRVGFDVVVDPPKNLDVGNRQASLRARAVDRLAHAARVVLIGDTAQIRAVAEVVTPAQGAVWRLVERVDLSDQAGFASQLTGEGVTRWARVAYDPHLGYLGGVAPACGRLHVAWRTYAVRNAAQGLVTTRLGRPRPRLVDVLPDWGPSARAQPCPDHRGAPVLTVAVHRMNA